MRYAKGAYIIVHNYPHGNLVVRRAFDSEDARRLADSLTAGDGRESYVYGPCQARNVASDRIYTARKGLTPCQTH